MRNILNPRGVMPLHGGTIGDVLKDHGDQIWDLDPNLICPSKLPILVSLVSIFTNTNPTGYESSPLASRSHAYASYLKLLIFLC